MVSNQDVLIMLIKVDERRCFCELYGKKEELDRSCAQRKWTIEGLLEGRMLEKKSRGRP